MNNNAIHRLNARNALKQNLGAALLVALIAALPSLLSQVGYLPLEQQLLQSLAQYAQGSISEALYMQRVQQLTSTTSFYLLQGFVVLAVLVLSPALQLGQRVFTLHLLRKEEAKVSDVLSRFGLALKAIWLNILTGLRLLLCMLPLIVMLVIVLLMAVTSSGGDRAYGLASVLYIISAVVSSILLVRATFSYALAPWILADHPDKKASACLRDSKQRMDGNRMQLFLLELSFILWNLLAIIVSNLVAELIPLLGTTLQMALTLAVSMYMLTAVGSFYLDTVPSDTPAKEFVVEPDEAQIS